MSRISILLILISFAMSDLISAAPVNPDHGQQQEQARPTQPHESPDGRKESGNVNGNTGDDNNWSVTQKWLISSINQLKGEMNQLGHNYNEHMEEEVSKESHSQQSLAHDLAVLRADHTILSQQQQMIIKLLKERTSAVPASSTTLVQVQEKLASAVEVIGVEQGEEEGEEEDDDGVKDTSSPHHGKHHHHSHRGHRRKHEKFDQLKDREERFEETSSNQIRELVSELTALHDITIAMFHEMQDIEKKVEHKDDQK